jgi:hypothetical protein
VAVLVAGAPALAQRQPDAGMEGGGDGGGDAAGNPQAYRLITSPRFSSAVRRCETRRDAGMECTAYRTMIADASVSPEHVTAILASGDEDESGSQGSGSGLRTEVVAPLGESVDAVASATALFELASMGLASFLVDRARVELQRGASENIRTRVCHGGATAEGLLQHTCALIDGSGDTFGEVGFGAGLRTAFERDVLALPMRAVDALPSVSSDADRPTRAVQRLVLGLTTALARESSPLAVAEALQSLSGSSDSNGLPQELKNAVRSFRAVMLAVSVASESSASRSSVVRARILQTAWIAVNGTPLDDQRLPQLFELGRSAFDAQQAARDLGDPTLSDATRRGRIASFAGNLLRALKSTLVLEIPTTSSNVERATFTRIEQHLSRVIPIFDALATGDVARVLAATLGLLREIHAMPSGAEMALRVLALGAEFASARTARQAEAAIMAFAAPPGAWQSRFQRGGVWLNGYVGLGGGGESLIESGSPRPVGAYMAPFAPVGIDVTRPVLNNQFALGLFVSLIDVGALVSASSAQPMNSTGPMPRSGTSPGQFLAPGLHGRINLGRSPLVLSAGVTLLPFGREVDYGMGRVESVPAVRLGGAVSVDLPILPFTF